MNRLTDWVFRIAVGLAALAFVAIALALLIGWSETTLLGGIR